MTIFNYSNSIDLYFVSLLKKENLLFNLIEDYFKNTNFNNYEVQEKKINSFKELNIHIRSELKEDGELKLTFGNKSFLINLSRKINEDNEINYSYLTDTNNKMLITNKSLAFKKEIESVNLLEQLKELQEDLRYNLSNNIVIGIKNEDSFNKTKIMFENLNVSSSEYTMNLTEEVNKNNIDVLEVLKGNKEKYKESIEIAEFNLLKNDDNILIDFLKNENIFNFLSNERLPIKENKNLLRNIQKKLGIIK